MGAVVLIVRRRHLSTCDRMLPSGLRHLVGELVYQFAAGTLAEFGTLAVGDMSYEEGIVSGFGRMHGKSVKVESIVRWQGER